VLLCRAIDDTGAVQPTRASLVRELGERPNYHNNGIQAWSVAAGGEISNVFA
jgi:sulfane dehydrogenase subunit SoxC